MNEANPVKGEALAVSTLLELANFSGVELTGHTVTLPFQSGAGTLKQAQVEPGFHISCWNMQLKDSLTVNRPARIPGQPRLFQLYFILTPDQFHIDGPSMARELRFNASMETLFESGDADFTYTFAPGKAAKVLVLQLHPDWLMNTFGQDDTSFARFLNKMVSEEKAFVFHEPVSLTLQQSLTEFHNHFISENRDRLYNKARALTLLSDFLYGLSLRSTLDNSPAAYYEEKIRAVEDILRQHLESQLPCIRTIAEKVSLSESTLKRYFHQIYRRSIYDYYLQLKMEHARHLLEEKQIAVKEVAYQLGYEKCSSFILMFKKFYSESPGFFRQKTLLNPGGV